MMAGGRRNPGLAGEGARIQQQVRNAIQGAQNREAGKMFERQIEDACDHYRATGAADIEKTPEPIRQLGKKDGAGRFMACYEKRAQPDYKGTLEGGRSIVFEAKHTSTEKMEQKVVLEQQAQALDRHEKLGAACFVIVSFGLTDFYRVPWKAWKNMKDAYGRQYIRKEDVEQYRVKRAGGLIDFLRRYG